MNTYHLKYFLDAAKSGSVSESAKKNNISHSAISQAIKNLESELGIDLVKHSKRKFELTTEGKASIPYLDSFLAHLSKVKSTLQNTHQEPIGDFVIWAPQSLIVDSLIGVLMDYRRLYPKIKMRVYTGAAYLVRQAVSQNRCNIGISLNDHKMHNYKSLNVASGEFVLVSRNSKAKVESSKILATDPDKVEVQYLASEMRKKLNNPPELNTFILSWGLLREFLLAEENSDHNTIGYLPDYVVKKELKTKQLYKIDQPWKPFKYEVSAIWSPHGEMDRNTKLFVELLRQRG